MVSMILRQYGTKIQLTHGGVERTVKGFFQPVRSKSWQSMESEATLLGEITRGQYAYIGPAEGGIREGDTLMLGDRSYLVRRAEYYYFQDRPVYQWGLCVEKGVNDTWGSRS